MRIMSDSYEQSVPVCTAHRKSQVLFLPIENLPVEGEACQLARSSLRVHRSDKSYWFLRESTNTLKMTPNFGLPLSLLRQERQTLVRPFCVQNKKDKHLPRLPEESVFLMHALHTFRTRLSVEKSSQMAWCQLSSQASWQIQRTTEITLTTVSRNVLDPA